MAHKLIQDWQDWFEHSKGRSAATVATYERYLDRLDIYLFNKEKELITANRADLEAFSGKEAHKEGLKPASRRPLISAIRSFYGWLLNQGHIESNPAEKLVYPRAGKPLPTLIRLQSLEMLFSDCKDLDDLVTARDAAMLAVLASTGIRVSGLVGLNEESIYVETDKNGLTIYLLRVEEKGKKERIVPLRFDSFIYLDAYLQHPEFLAMKSQRLLENGEHVLFIQMNRGKCPEHEWYGEARRLGKNSVGNMLHRRGSRLGIPDKELHPHAFRHLVATEYSEDGVPLNEIQMLLGHESIEYTRLYIRLSIRRLAATVERSSPMAKIVTAGGLVARELQKRGAH
jgi:site-specific recombinase XerD